MMLRQTFLVEAMGTGDTGAADMPAVKFPLAFPADWDASSQARRCLDLACMGSGRKGLGECFDDCLVDFINCCLVEIMSAAVLTEARHQDLLRNPYSS